MEKTKRKMMSVEPYDAKKALSYQNLFWFFMIGNVLGMLLEGIWCVITLGRWETHTVTVWGPFCLIYGIGFVGMMIAYAKLGNKKPAVQFIVVALVADVVEYLSAALLQNAVGMRAWDYSMRPFNIKGRVTLGMTFVWGVLGILFIKYIVPFILKVFDKMHGEGWKITCAVLSVFMAVNIAFTAGCILRWSERHYDYHVMPASFSSVADEYYPDGKMKKIFCEWQFLDDVVQKK